MIKDYIRENVLVTDGAMGTYYAQITGDTASFCEFANIEKPEIIKKIHDEYIEAGAKLIRTNTFSANSITLGVDRDRIKEIIENGYAIAKRAAGDSVFVAASIGPIVEAAQEGLDSSLMDEYRFIVDTFMECGARLFVFETFSSVDYIEEISNYIKDKDKSAFIITQFAVMPDGYTRKGIGIRRIVDEVKEMDNVDIYGFNCGSGPTHLFNLIKKLHIGSDVISVLPNAGYPEVVNERTVFVNNPDYFAEKMRDIKKLGVKIIGGCCGTTPQHIKALTSDLNFVQKENKPSVEGIVKENQYNKKAGNSFMTKLKNNEFVIAVELDPPFDTSIDKIMHGAKVCKDNGIDIVTVADSPRSVVRVDSVMISAKIKREIGIDAMPHICCRDKNTNALRSGVLAAHIEGIRNVLAITGDPVSDTGKQGTKSVFNMNSFGFIELLSEMNKEAFHNDDIFVGGALNLNVLNKNMEIKRMQKKIEKGAKFFLTQPIYDDEVIEFLKEFKSQNDIKILGGIMPVVNLRNAQFLNNEMPGIHIPQKYLERFHADMSREEAEEVGINMAVEISNKIKNYVDGFYFITPFNRVEMIMKIIKSVNF
jgi:methionine synthase I (cobalamin-dependent)/5,10-methylenetetrahydrofolate reductase